MTDLPLLQVEGISKAFGEVIANSEIDFDLRAGEIHALVGENGAGKTTLMQILFGMLRPDHGTIRLSGEAVQFRSPKAAIAHGIGMVHQHFMLVPEFTVAQNATLGAERSRGGLVSRRATAAALEAPMRTLAIDVDLDAVTASLSIAQQQRVEILKLLYRGARIMILDEPTAVLTPQETEDLFRTLRRMAAEGYAVIFISHKLREVVEIADRITVLRSGRTIRTFATAEVDIPTVVAAMTGSDSVNLGRVTRRAAPGPDIGTVLEVADLCGRATGDVPVDNVCLTLRAGEIVGVAGVDGNGQRSLTGLLTGTAEVEAGRIRLAGQTIDRLPVVARRAAGMAFVPEDRHSEGLPMRGSVLDGLVGVRLATGLGGRGLAPAIGAELRAWGRRIAADYGIKTATIDAPCRTLSGGNQQKIVIARELESRPRCIVLAQPTRGVDLGAADLVYASIARAADQGAAVLMVSADLDELLRVTDRILVMYRGRIVAEHRTAETSREQLGLDMAGGSIERQAA